MVHYLNESQRAAVCYVDGPCLVLAGAGSGKTRVITEKALYLVRELGYQPNQVVAITFTNKAAREMRLRLQKSHCSDSMKGMTLTTFHSLGLEILRKNTKEIGLKSGFSLCGDSDQRDILKDLTESELKGDLDALQALQTQISAWKNLRISPEAAMESAKSKPEAALARQYVQYARQLTACSLVDFDDLIGLPITFFSENPEALESYQKKLRYLLIDEYQDTNHAQYELMKLLAGSRACLTVVGDDDQAIYAWRGARSENLIRLQTDFHPVKVIKLEHNYRSTQPILEAANALIAHNPHIFSKRLFSHQPSQAKIRLFEAENEFAEADAIVTDLQTQRTLQRADYKQYGILYRSHHQAKLFETVLMQRGIPYQISGSHSFFDRAEIKLLMRYCRLLVNLRDDSAFLRVVNTPKRGIGTATLQKLGLWATQRERPLMHVIEDMGLLQQLQPLEYRRLAYFKAQISSYSERCLAESVGEAEIQSCLLELLAEIRFFEWIEEHASTPKAAGVRRQAVYDFLSWLVDLLKAQDTEAPLTFAQAVQRMVLRELLDRQASDHDPEDAVQLMTIHAAKGLEFHTVYLCGLEEGILPHHAASSEEAVQEERRLVYVGMTRAQKHLAFSLCRTRKRYGEVLAVEPSRFLQELPEKALLTISESPEQMLSALKTHGKRQLAGLRAQLKG